MQTALLRGQFYFSPSGVVSCTFCARVRVLYTYSTFDHHPHSIGYPCAKFHFYHAPIAELAREKNWILSQSLTHSPSLFDLPGTEAFASELLLHLQESGNVTSYISAAWQLIMKRNYHKWETEILITSRETTVFTSCICPDHETSMILMV